MLEFFKTMKDSFHGNQKKDCYREGLFISQEARDFISSDAKKAEDYAKMAKSHLRTMSIYFLIALFGLVLDRFITGEYHFALPAIFAFQFLIQLCSWISTVNKSMELVHKRLSKMEERSEQKLLNQQESSSVA